MQANNATTYLPDVRQSEIQETIPTTMPKEESAECLVLPPATQATSWL